MPIGAGVDGAAYDPSFGDIFASCSYGTLTIIHEDSPDKYHVVQTLKTGENGKNMGLDIINHRIYVVAARFEKPSNKESAGNRYRAKMIPGSFIMMMIERADSSR